MHRTLKRWIGLLVLGLALARPAAAQGPVANAEEQAIRAVIADQMAAFRRDDAAAAFAHASPSIQAIFGTPETFMAMVRRGYQPVYRPSEVAFGALGLVDGALVQRVTVVGPDGVPVLALYIMQRQPDGSWRINGCILTESGERTS